VVASVIPVDWGWAAGGLVVKVVGEEVVVVGGNGADLHSEGRRTGTASVTDRTGNNGDKG
jgi:hypothetical protein